MTETPTPTLVAELRFLALGDSYTIGADVLPEERWPVQLAGLLRENGYPLSEPVIVAHTGWTTGELAAGIERAELQPEYSLVSLLIGVNNQFRGYNQESYKREFAALLEQAIALAGGRAGQVVVLSIPDWGVTPFAAGSDRSRIAAEIDAFNDVNRTEANRLGALYIDVTPVSRQASEDSSLLAPDGLHPSGKMYAAWAELVLPVVIRALEH